LYQISSETLLIKWMISTVNQSIYIYIF